MPDAPAGVHTQDCGNIICQSISVTLTIPLLLPKFENIASGILRVLNIKL
jgi:hypothetical protein